MYGTTTADESTFVCPGNGVINWIEYTAHLVPANLSGIENPSAYSDTEQRYDSISFRCTTSLGENKIFGKKNNFENVGGALVFMRCPKEDYYIRNLYLRDMKERYGIFERNKFDFDCGDSCGNFVKVGPTKPANNFYDSCNGTIARGPVMIKIWANEFVNGFQVKYGIVPLEHNC